MCSKELKVKGSFRYGPGDYEAAIRLVATGRVNVAALITKRVPFDKAEDAFKEMAAGKGIKTLIYGPVIFCSADSELGRQGRESMHFRTGDSYFVLGNR